MLTGHVTGYSRQELLDEATKQAIAYYAPEDHHTIEITLRNEQATHDGGYADSGLLSPPGVVFEAEYTAQLPQQSAHSECHSTLDKVRSVHEQIERTSGEYVCVSCDVPYPCPTLVAIDGLWS